MPVLSAAKEPVRRIKKNVDGYTTRCCYDGDHVIAECDGNNKLVRKYICGTWDG